MIPLAAKQAKEINSNRICFPCPPAPPPHTPIHPPTRQQEIDIDLLAGADQEAFCPGWVAPGLPPCIRPLEATQTQKHNCRLNSFRTTDTTTDTPHPLRRHRPRPRPQASLLSQSMDTRWRLGTPEAALILKLSSEIGCPSSWTRPRGPELVDPKPGALA